MTESDIFTLYQEKFKSIYADLVAITGEKFLEVDAQIESAMSHLAAGKTSQDQDVLQNNLNSAYNHIARACLDAAKLLWLNRRQEVNKVMKDSLKADFCFKSSNGKINQLYHEAESLMMQARRQDAAVAGHASMTLIENYYQAISKLQSIIEDIDWEKVDKLQKFRYIYVLKQQSTGFILGILASVAASFIYSAVTISKDNDPPKKPEATNLKSSNNKQIVQ